MLHREKVEMSVERRVLSNLIMSTPLLAKCYKAGDPSMFESTMSRIVATWVWEFFSRTGDAPGQAITDIYRQRASELKEADADMVYTFLSSCSDEWLPSNVAYSTDMAIKYFRLRTLAALSEKLSRAVQMGDVSAGEHAVADYVKPDVKKSTKVNMFRDATIIAQAFENTDEEIFMFPGELGRIIGPFIREDFIAFIGPPKSGKTWWLMIFAVQAALQGCKVLFVSLEMSELQTVRRFWQMINGKSRYGEEVAWPEFEDVGDGEKFRIVDNRYQSEKVDTDPGDIDRLQQTIRRVSRTGELQVITYPSRTLSVRGLEAELKDMEVYEAFVPNVIVVDYADIMDLGSGNDERDKINRTWISLRGLASKIKGIVATVSQTGRETVGGSKDATENTVSEDIRKVAHVTKMITINHTPEEKDRGIVRLACNTNRDGAPVNDQVVCTSCLAIGRPYLDCKLLSAVDMGREEEYVNDPDDDMPERSAGRRTGSRGRR